MSFCYAEITNELDHKSVSIYTDTKIGFDKFSGASFSPFRKELIKKYGIVKCTICNNDLCIAFAGNNIGNASNLFKKLYEYKSFELANVADIAFQIHKQAVFSDDIEFIIAYYEKDRLHLDCVKENQIKRNVPNCHIGSSIAFRCFQKRRLETDNVDLAFRDVVEGYKANKCTDDSVGGFAIKIWYNQDNDSFEFENRYEIFSPGPIIVRAGEVIPFYTNVQDGNYSYYIKPISISECFLDIEQMNSKILYSRDKRFDNEVDNDFLFGLMLPFELNYFDDQWYIGNKNDHNTAP